VSARASRSQGWRKWGPRRRSSGSTIGARPPARPATSPARGRGRREALGEGVSMVLSGCGSIFMMRPGSAQHHGGGMISCLGDVRLPVIKKPCWRPLPHPAPGADLSRERERQKTRHSASSVPSLCQTDIQPTARVEAACFPFVQQYRRRIGLHDRRSRHRLPGRQRGEIIDRHFRPLAEKYPPA
jgi:hypothetical protein